MDWKSNPNRKSLAILRISSKRQEGNSSHEIQDEKIRRYCIDNGLELAESRKIIESAKRSDLRRKYSDAINFALSKKVFHILFYMNDREARNLTDSEKNEILVREGKIVIHYVNDNKVFHQNSPSADFLSRDINAVMNKNFSRVLGEKVNDSMKKKASDGWYPGNHPPVGYVHQKQVDSYGKVQKRGTIIVPDPDPRRRRQVQREFELRSQGLSIELIRAKVIEEGLIERFKIPQYSKHGIETRLKSKFYWGLFDWQGIEYQGRHELIIDQRILQRVKDSFGKRGITRRASHELGIFSGGWIKCADPECELQVVYDPKKKVNKTTKEVRHFHFYRCSNSRGFHKSLKGRYVTEDSLWQQFESAVDRIDIDQILAQRIADALNEANSLAKAAIHSRAQEHQAALDKLEQLEDRIYDDYRAGILDDAGYRKQVQRVREDRRHYTQLLRDSNLAISDAWKVSAQRVIELATNAKSLWNQGSPQERMDYLKKVCSNPMLDMTNLRYDLKKPFVTIAEMKENKDWRSQGDLNPCILREREVS